MKILATNAPMQLRKKIHVGSFLDIVYLDLIKKYLYKDIGILIAWNALGLFREKDGTTDRKNFVALQSKMNGFINRYYQGRVDLSHFIDDDNATFQTVFEIVKELIAKDVVCIKEYNALYCSVCNSHPGPASHDLAICSRCSNKLTQEMTSDLFINVNKEEVIICAEESTFYPAYTKNKFLGAIVDLPTNYAITKTRRIGFSAETFDPALAGKVIDPKFIFSLLPVILNRQNQGKLELVVIGEDILARYLYHLFANCATLMPQRLKIYIHGMLKSGQKKISKYGNFPEATDLVEFLERWSWDHLKLLCMYAKFGKNIDFDQAIEDIERLLTKRKNVLIFLHDAQDSGIAFNDAITNLENEIIEYCMTLFEYLQNFELNNFYRGYRKLWYELLSQRYIHDLKKGGGSIEGLSIIIKNCIELLE